MSSIKWVNKKAVLWIHAEQIKEHGGVQGLLNEGHLDACLKRPQTTYRYDPQTSPYTLAAIYAQSFIESHPFLDGNKRTALVVCLLFLRLNGVCVKASKHDMYHAFYSLASGTNNLETLAHWLEAQAE